MSTVPVRVRFVSGAINYTFPYVYSISDPKEGMKATVIQGNRADGVIIIPGGKKSQEIFVKGRLLDNSGYTAVNDLMDTLKTNITTDVGTLYLEEYISGAWTTNWSYTVRRLDEIVFPESLRTTCQEYEIKFLVLVY